MTPAEVEAKLRRMAATPMTTFHYREDVGTVLAAADALSAQAAEIERMRGALELIVAERSGGMDGEAWDEGWKAALEVFQEIARSALTGKDG